MNIVKLLLPLALASLASCTQPSNKDTATSHHQLAAQSAAALRTNDFATAQRLAAEATRLNPDFAEAWVGYGMASLRLGQINRAREAYENALSLHLSRQRKNPSDVNQVVQQIFLLVLLNRNDEAALVLKRAQNEHPDNRQIVAMAAYFTEVKSSWQSWAVERK